MSFQSPTPPVRQKPPRHALLFELIRQRNMAKFISDRVENRPPAAPTHLDHLARSAGRSLGMPPETRPPVL